MKIPKRVKVRGPFSAGALEVLRRIPGVTAAAANRGEIDFWDARHRLAIEVKPYVSAAGAAMAVEQLRNYLQTTPQLEGALLVADRTTAEARQILMRNGLSFVDGAGHAHIDLPGVFVHVEGEGDSGRPGMAGQGPRLSGKAGVAVQAMLLEAQRVWRVKDLAEVADISVGLAHRLLARLEVEGVVSVDGAGPTRVRRLANPGALLDLWTEEQVDRGVRRTLGFLLEQTPGRILRTLSSNLAQAEIRHALTGAAGASLVAPFVTSLPVIEVWVPATASPEELLDAGKVDPVTDGQNVVFLQAKDDTPLAFERRVQDASVVNPMRLYLDLRRDPRRGREQADHLREEVMGF